MFVCASFLGSREDKLSSVAPLGHMMWNTRSNHVRHLATRQAINDRQSIPVPRRSTSCARGFEMGFTSSVPELPSPTSATSKREARLASKAQGATLGTSFSALETSIRRMVPRWHPSSQLNVTINTTARAAPHRFRDTIPLLCACGVFLSATLLFDRSASFAPLTLAF
jgi:hypothetical protein